MRVFGVKGAVALLAALLCSTQAMAKGVTLLDNYVGGYDTWSGSGVAIGSHNGATLYDGQVIGDPSIFGITSANIQRIGPGGDTLQIVINTNYAGNGGVDGTGYGALFLTPGVNAWRPSGSAANGYATDQYKPGEWAYAASMPMVPTQMSGTGGLYAVASGNVVLSNVYGSQTTYPYVGNPGWYFRQGQAVQFTTSNASIASESWSIDPSAHTVTFQIVDNGLLGNNFALSWAMTCGNDVIQGQVAGVPEPSTWAMMLVGFAGLGAVANRRRARRKAA